MDPRILFLFLCIPARLFLIYLSRTLPEDKQIYLGILFLIMGLLFLWLYFTNGRMNAPEEGGITWWSRYRLIHGVLYLTAAIYAFKKDNLIYVPLVIDILFGIALFVNKRIIN